MPAAPSFARLALLLGLAFFFGLAFEEFYDRGSQGRPGGVRTFPLLALAAGMLYLLDPVRLLGFVAGLLVLGAWLFANYREQLRRGGPVGEPAGGLMVPICNVHAYLLGAVALAFPPWLAVAVTVASVLLLTGRDRLHALARRVPTPEIVIAGQFLILTGIILPLLPNVPVTTLTTITPRQAWLALLAVCTISYATYLAQKAIAPREGDLVMAMLGGAYSSTATTVVLARRARADPAMGAHAQAGITLATALMYVRILIVVAVFNLALARVLLLPLASLAVVGLGWAGLRYRLSWRAARPDAAPYAPRNPLELGAAALFAALYVGLALLSNWITAAFGRAGIYGLAAVVGFTDIDPFVLSLAQGGTTRLSLTGLATAILIASSSNNLLKACYAGIFAGWRKSFETLLSLLALAALGLGWGILLGGL